MADLSVVALAKTDVKEPRRLYSLGNLKSSGIISLRYIIKTSSGIG